MALWRDWKWGCCALLLAACGEDDHTHETPTECGERSYEKSAQPFVERYCISCHSSGLVADARRGAPPDVNFGTLEQLMMHGSHAAELVREKKMPWPSAPLQPSDAERNEFLLWMSCSGTDQLDDHGH